MLYIFIFIFVHSTRLKRILFHSSPENCSMVITWWQFLRGTCWPHGQGTWISWQRRRWGNPSTSTIGGLRCSATWQKWHDRNWTWTLPIQKYTLPKWIELQKTGPFSSCVFFCIGFCWHHSVLFTSRILWPSLPRWFQRAMRDPAHFYKKWTVQRLIFVCDHDPPNLGYVVVHWMCRVERVRFDWGSNPLFFCFLFQNMFTVSLFNCFSLTKELYQTCWLFKIAFSEKMLLDSVQHAQNQPATCDLFQIVISSTQGSCLTF